MDFQTSQLKVRPSLSLTPLRAKQDKKIDQNPLRNFMIGRAAKTEWLSTISKSD
jgi:hypothetical protein